MQSIGLKAKPKIIDLTRKVGTVETLTEARIHCSNEEKVKKIPLIFQILVSFFFPIVTDVHPEIVEKKRLFYHYFDN